MYIGLGIVLLVLGLVFALDVITVDMNYIDEGALGTILIIGGILAILLSLFMSDRYRRRTTVVEQPRTVVEQPPVVEERRYR